MSDINPEIRTVEDLEEMAALLERSGAFKVQRKLAPRIARTPAADVQTRLGLLVDTETTGLDHTRHEIIELAMVPFTYGLDGEIYEVGATFGALRQPAKPIPPEIMRITGITDVMVEGRSIDPLEVAAFAAPAALVVAHNAAFDRRFLSHHVSMTAPALGAQGAALAVSAAAISAFIGRVLLARYSDRVDVRLTTGLVLLVAGLSLISMAIFDGPTGLMASSVAYGLTVGNVTTLSPIVVRREFGATSFGAVFGIASSLIAFATAFGPGFFGAIRDAYDSYGPALLLAGSLNLVAAAVIVWGRSKPLPPPS